MRTFRVKVTTDLEEYYAWTGGDRDWLKGSYGGKYPVKGMYFNGHIWVRTLNPFTLFHEFIHHIIGHSDDVWYISVRLFGDILNCIWDISYFRLTWLRAPKERSQEALRRLKASINDWLDWVLCR